MFFSFINRASFASSFYKRDSSVEHWESLLGEHCTPRNSMGGSGKDLSLLKKHYFPHLATRKLNSFTIFTLSPLFFSLPFSFFSAVTPLSVLPSLLSLLLPLPIYSKQRQVLMQPPRSTFLTFPEYSDRCFYQFLISVLVFPCVNSPTEFSAATHPSEVTGKDFEVFVGWEQPDRAFGRKFPACVPVTAQISKSPPKTGFVGLKWCTDLSQSLSPY